MNCVTYARVSTDKEAEKDLSLPAQLTAMREYASRKDWTVVQEFVEPGASAKTSQRPVLQEMLACCQRTDPRIDVVLVHKVDRLARNVFDHASIRALLTQHRIALASVVENVDDSVTGQLVENIMASIAQFYSANLAEEVRKGMGQRVKQGGWPHRAPIGYHVVPGPDGGRSRIEIDPIRGPLMQQAFERYAAGWYSVRRLTTDMAERGLVGDSGRPVAASHLREMLENPFYVGRLRWKGADYNGAHAPLVSEALFLRVHDVLRRRYRAPGEKGRRRFLLRGLALCENCGARMTAEQHRRWGYYRCCANTKGARNCRAKFCPVDVAHDTLASLYQRLQISDELRTKVRAVADRLIEERVTAARGRRGSLTIQRTRVLEREIRLAEAFSAAEISPEVYKAVAGKMRRQIVGIDAGLKEANLRPTALRAKVDQVLDMAVSLSDLHRRFDEAARTRLSQTLFSTLVLNEHGVVDYTLHAPFDRLLTLSPAPDDSPRGPPTSEFEDRQVKPTIESILEVDMSSSIVDST